MAKKKIKKFLKKVAPLLAAGLGAAALGRRKQNQTYLAEEGGDIEDAPKKKSSGIMMASNIENDEILESLFEKYLEMG